MKYGKPIILLLLIILTHFINTNTVLSKNKIPYQREKSELEKKNYTSLGMLVIAAQRSRLFPHLKVKDLWLEKTNLLNTPKENSSLN